MRPPQSWLYPANLAEATEVQKVMAAHVVVQDQFVSPKWVAGVDVSNNLRDPTHMIYAAAVFLEWGSLALVETKQLAKKQQFPYIPGFLGFREAPAIFETMQSLERRPDLILVDGHGICHPRGLGIASHLGVLCDIPTIGVAKKILVGEPEGQLGPKQGDSVPLVWKGKVVGKMLRSRVGAQPLIVSPGHRVSLDTAVHIVMKCLSGYRLPEPTRQAHLAANAERKRYLKAS